METAIVYTCNNIDDLNNLKSVPIPTYSKIELNESLDFVEPQLLIQTLFEIKSKLLPQGKISIHSYDLYELAYELVNDHFQTADFNLIIKDRKQVLTVPDLIFLLKKLEFLIISKDIDANKYYIEAQNV